MSKLAQQKRMKALKGTVIFGLVTAACYLAVFLNSGLVMKYFTKGGVYALLPVGTAIGIYTLWVLTQDETRALFERTRPAVPGP